MAQNAPPLFKIASILDGTTFVITGKGIEELPLGQHLAVYAEGPKIPGIVAPVLLEKAALEVTQVAPEYAIVRPPQVEVETNAFAGLTGERKVWRRPSLGVLEQEKTGNPAAGPIRVGDFVFRPGDLKAVVSYLAGQSLLA